LNYEVLTNYLPVAMCKLLAYDLNDATATPLSDILLKSRMVYLYSAFYSVCLAKRPLNKGCK